MAIITKADGTKVSQTIVKSGGKMIVTEKNISTGQTTTKVIGGSSSSTKKSEVSTMAKAGDSISNLYSDLDAKYFAGKLPGGAAESDGVNPLTAGGIGKYAIGGAVGLAAGIGGAMLYNYFKKDGTPRKLKANGQPYKKPSMNYANPKALSRATRRLKSFKDHYAKSVRALGYHVTRTGGK